MFSDPGPGPKPPVAPTPDEMVSLLLAARKDLNNRVDPAVVDDALMQKIGMTHAQLIQAAQAHPVTPADTPEGRAVSGQESARRALAVARGAIPFGASSAIAGLSAGAPMITPGLAPSPAAPPIDVNQNFENTRNLVDREQQAFHQEHPILDPALQIGGGFLGMGAAAPESFWGRVAMGSGLGAAQGAGNAEAGNALHDALIGLGVGGGGTAGLEGLGRLGFWAARELWRGVAPEIAASRIAQRVLQRIAVRKQLNPVAGALEADRLQAAAPGQANLTDVYPELRGPARANLEAGGGSSQATRMDLAQRARQAQPEMQQDLQQLGGTYDAPKPSLRTATPGNKYVGEFPGSVPQDVDRFISQEGHKLYAPYDARFPNGVPPTAEMRGLLQDPNIRAAWNTVRPVDRAGLEKIDYLVNEMKVPYERALEMVQSAGTQMPTPSQWNGIARNLSANAHRAVQSGVGDPLAFEALAKQVRDAMERTPGLEGIGAANKGYSQLLSLHDAANAGWGLDPAHRANPQLLASVIQGAKNQAGPYADQAVDYLRRGAFSRTLLDVASAPGVDTRHMTSASQIGADVVNRFGKLADDLFPGATHEARAAAAADWAERTHARGVFHDTFTALQGGSNTSSNLAEQADQADVPGMVTAVMSGRRGIIKAIADRLNPDIGSPAVSRALRTLMLSRDPATLAQAMEIIRGPSLKPVPPPPLSPFAGSAGAQTLMEYLRNRAVPADTTR